MSDEKGKMSTSFQVPTTLPTSPRNCPYCSTGTNWVWHSGQCPKVKAIEYYPNGTIKRVEFK